MTSNNLEFGEFIKFKVKKKFGIITLNRAHRGNALTTEMVKNLKKAIEYCQINEKIRGVMITGEGSSFTTGMDMDAIDGGNHEQVEDYEGTASEIVKLLYFGKPVICAINGKAMGDGVAYSICADYRIAVKETYFQMPEIFSGIFPGGGTVVVMTKVLGIPWTKKILMFAEKINAEKALKIGLIDEIVSSKEELMSRAFERARFLFTKNQTVLNAIKLSSNHLLDKSYNDAYILEKKASWWFTHEDKNQFIEDFRKEI